jgi:SPP1 gp7 family putative phage head morphogenesis protein
MQEQTRQILYPALPALVMEANNTKPVVDRADDYSDNLTQLIQSLSVSIDKNNPIPSIPTMTLDIGQKTSKWNQAQWQKTMKQVTGVNTAQYEPWLQSQLKSFSGENVSLIKSLKDQNLTSIEGMTQRALRSGQRHEEIARQIEAQYETTRNRAKLIARDQVSKLNGQLTQLRQNDIGINEYIWRTSGDERVRSNHKVMDGKKCRWDDPTVFWNGAAWVSRKTISGIELHPGGDYQCRCWAEPVFDSIYQSIDAGQYVSPGAPVVPIVPQLPIPPVIPKPVVVPVAPTAAAAVVLRGLKPGFNPTGRVATPVLADQKAFTKLVKSRGLSKKASFGSAIVAPETLQDMAERATWYDVNFGIKTDNYKNTKQRVYAINSYSPLTKETTMKVGVIKDRPRALKHLADEQVSKFHPEKCDTIKSVIDHEYGHTIWNTRMNPESKAQMRLFYATAMKNKKVKDELSGYARKEVEEFMAEGWAEFTNNPSPRRIAKFIAKIIQEGWK